MSTSKTSETYRSLKAQLLDGAFRPGEQLRIDALSESFAVSKGAVREALSRLTSDGLVANTPQKGFVVAPISADDLIDLTDVRIELERRCLELAIAKGDLAWEGRILSAYHRLSKTSIEAGSAQRGGNPDWTTLHAEFHDSLISACASAWRLKLREVTYLQAERYRRVSFGYVKRRRDVDAEHAAIMAATLERDAPRACALIEEHLRTTANAILASGFFDARLAG